MAVRVTKQEFKRLAKLSARAGTHGKTRGRCWHDVLLREKGTRDLYRCAVCGRIVAVVVAK